MNLEPDSITSNTYVASLAGAILGLKAITGATPAERLSNLVFGFLIAVYLGPVVVDYLHVTSQRVSAGLIFATGAGGLVVFAALIDGIKQTSIATIIAGWFSRSRGPQ